MNELKSQAVERIEQIAGNPTAQKIVATYSVGAGSSVQFELIQGWLGIVSVVVGIIAGLLVIRSNYRKGQVAEAEKLRAETERERAEVELRIKQVELERLKDSTNEQS